MTTSTLVSDLKAVNLRKQLEGWTKVGADGPNILFAAPGKDPLRSARVYNSLTKRLSDPQPLQVWFKWLRIEEAPDSDAEAKHLGPGPHPSGSPQSVHGTEGGEAAWQREQGRGRTGRGDPTWKFLGDDAKALQEAGLTDAEINEYRRTMALNSDNAVEMLRKYGLTKEEVYERLEVASRKARLTPEQRKLHLQADGTYTPERQKLHDEIVDDLFEGKTPAEGQPTMLMTGGLMGSGKSTMLKQPTFDHVRGFVHLDADQFRERLAKADGYKSSGYRAGAYQTETDDILAQAMARVSRENYNVILDLSMKTERKIDGMIDAFNDGGYRVQLAFAEVPLGVAVERAIGRFLAPGGRFVPPVAVAAHDKKNRRTMEAVSHQAADWWIYSTDVPLGDPPILLREGHPGKQKSQPRLGRREIVRWPRNTGRYR